MSVSITDNSDGGENDQVQSRPLLETSISVVDPRCFGNFVPVSIGNVATLALADSGAIISCMSSSFWSKVRYCKHLTPLYTSILGVGGEKHPICDRVELKIKIGNKLVSQDFHILQGHHDVILGVDFLNQHGVILDYAKVKWRHWFWARVALRGQIEVRHIITFN